ncbi:MAG: signal peptidase I [Treponema sp.]|nr:signal peptidase I [Treponema sp.]
MFKDIYAISYKMKRELYHKIFTIVFLVLMCFVFVNLFMNFVLFPVRNISVSMTPDIPEDGLELIAPLWRTPGRGDVMLMQPYVLEPHPLPIRFVNLLCRFVTAQQWQPFRGDKAGNRSSPFIRRVIGMPGDTLYLDKYLVYIKPKNENHFLTEFELTETKYDITVANPPDQWDQKLGSRGEMEEVVLGADEYFVLCDNRLESSDSRTWGVVKQSAFRGKVLLVYFPVNRFRVL